jgi:hypothetical protein
MNGAALAWGVHDVTNSLPPMSPQQNQSAASNWARRVSSLALLSLALAGPQAHASLIVLDPGAEPLQAPGLAVAGDWISRPLGLDRAAAWSLFPVNDQSCCVLGNTVVFSAVFTNSAAPTATGSNVLSLSAPARRSEPRPTPSAFGGPPLPDTDLGPAQGEKNMRSLVAAGLARGGDWSLAVALRDTVLPEFELGHCGNNHALCSTWVDNPELMAVKRGSIMASRALMPDRYLGPAVSLPEIETDTVSAKR